MSNRFVFVHIPKTAGTSFRKGIEEALSEDALFYDYGGDAKARNETVENYLYQKKVPDMLGFRAKIDNSRDAVVCGHFQVEKYYPYFSLGQIGAFFREPIARTISEYLHVKRHSGFNGDIKEFCKNRIFRNRQSFFMGGVDLNKLGFVGITEHYEDSLIKFNEYTGLQVPFLDINKANKYPAEINEEVFDYVRQFNEKDLELYSHALKIFNERKRFSPNLVEKVKTYASSIKLLRGNLIQGWAVCNEEPEISPFYYLILKGSVVRKFKANNFRLDLKNRSICRSGSIGFSFNIDPNALKRGNVFILSTSKSASDEINRLKIL